MTSITGKNKLKANSVLCTIQTHYTRQNNGEKY